MRATTSSLPVAHLRSLSLIVTFDESQGTLGESEEFGDLIVVVLVGFDGELGLLYGLAGVAQSVIDTIGEDLLYSQLSVGTQQQNVL
jgi:hypothetical protein